MNLAVFILGVYVVAERGLAEANTTADYTVWLGLTVSPLITTSPPRQLEISWRTDLVVPGDMVALYDEDPTRVVSITSLTQRNVTTDKGYFRTGYQDPVHHTAELGFSSRCLDYWAAYLRGGEVVAYKCLRTRPTWMSDYRGEIGRLRLRKMFIPGTHDSAAYKVYLGEGRDTLVTRNAITQEEDILSQLIYGVRYLDLRVGHYKLPEVWWANHGVVRLHTLRDIFAQIKTFLQNTDEIVILDIQEFNTGFGKDLDVHLKLVQFLVTELSSFMALPSLTWDARLEDVWQSGRRLIVTYDHVQVVSLSTLLWPAVEHRWGNVQSLSALHDYLKGVIARSPSHKPWAAMAELTPTPWLIVTNKLGGLRQMADLVNRNVTEWFSGPWGAVANVVAVDFFRGTEVVREAIVWNRRRAREEMFDRHRQPRTGATSTDLGEVRLPH